MTGHMQRHLRSPVRKRVDGESFPADGRCLEQRQPDELTVEAGDVCGDDAAAVHTEADEREVRTARGVSYEFLHAVTVAVP